LGHFLQEFRTSINAFYQSDQINIARIAFVGATVKVGLLLPLFTANVRIYTYVSWITWWMIGVGAKEYSEIKKIKYEIT
jgi:hypothetical protein